MKQGVIFLLSVLQRDTEFFSDFIRGHAHFLCFGEDSVHALFSSFSGLGIEDGFFLGLQHCCLLFVESDFLVEFSNSFFLASHNSFSHNKDSFTAKMWMVMGFSLGHFITYIWKSKEEVFCFVKKNIIDFVLCSLSIRWKVLGYIKQLINKKTKTDFVLKVKQPEKQNRFANFKKIKLFLILGIDFMNSIVYTGKHKRDLRKSKKTNLFWHQKIKSSGVQIMDISL